MQLFLAVFVLLVASAAAPARAQVSVLEHFNPISSKTGGVHLHGATLSSSYFSNSYGLGSLGVGGPGLGFGGIAGGNSDAPAAVMQGSAVFGWSKLARKSSASVIYSPSYVRSLHQSNYRSLNHTLSISFDSTLSPKWKFSGSLNGTITDFSQLLFARTQYGSISATPATFEEFFAAIMTGTSANPALTQVVNAAPLINSPETAYMYGDRLLSAASTVGVSYAYSTRSTFSMSVGASRTQPFKDGATGAPVQQSFVMPMTSSGIASVGWSYSLTPRTTLSVNGAATRTISRFQDAYNSQGTVSIGRTLSPRWFVHATAGTGIITPLRATFAPTDTAQHLYGGGIGYKMGAHTFLGSYMRSLSDLYGLGASATESSNGAWAWKRPRGTVSASVSFGYSRLKSPAFPNSSSWSGNGGVGKALGRHLALSVGFSYARFPQTVVVQGVPNLTQSGVVTTLSWSPSVRE